MRRGRALALALGAALSLCSAEGHAQIQPIVIQIRASNPHPVKPTAPLNSLQDLARALVGCWNPPAPDARGPVDVIFQVSFKRSGELFGKPRVIQFAQDVTPEQRGRYYTAVAEALDRCSSLPFTESMGGAVAGRVFRITFLDMRNRKQASWLTMTTS